MTNWMVAAHGSIEHDKANKLVNRIRSDARYFRLPGAIEVVFYCPDETSLSMAGGWKL